MMIQPVTVPNPSPAPVAGSSPLRLRPRDHAYIVAPAGVTTGGPEALHQLGAMIRSVGRNASMVYACRADPAVPLMHGVARGGRAPVYEQYAVPETHGIPDVRESVVVLPEVWTDAIHEFRRARVAIWWLSVDNNLVSPFGRYFDGHPRCPVAAHLYHTRYAAAFLQSHAVSQAYRLGDYLRPGHLRGAPVLPGLERQRIVLFNPKKGFETTQRIVERATERGMSAMWMPIMRLSPDDVALLMRMSMVYVDFGHHPGVDRMPREAAMAGCCVVTGRRGAAAFAEDIPIPGRFRVPDDDIDGAVDRVTECLDAFERTSAEFESYREWIRRQQAVFEADVRALFVG